MTFSVSAEIYAKYMHILGRNHLVYAESVFFGQGQKEGALQLHPPQRSLSDQQDWGEIQAQSTNNAHQGKFLGDKHAWRSISW